jgi:hypothetical protein
MSVEKKLVRSDWVKMVKDQFVQDLSKDQIMFNLVQSGCKFSDLQSVVKESGVKFRRGKGNSWKDISVDLWVENFNLSKKEMNSGIHDSVKDSDYYVRGYYHVFKRLVKEVREKVESEMIEKYQIKVDSK